MSRDSLDHPTSNAFRVREATRGIYYHAQEQLYRTSVVESDLLPSDPHATEWKALVGHLQTAVDALRAANDLSHAIGSRAVALRDQQPQRSDS